MQVLLNQWVEATYLSPRVRAQVQAQMERASEVCLRDVLLPARCERLLHALQQPDVLWERCGPAQQRRYERVAWAWVSEGGDEGTVAGAAGDDEHPVRGVLRVFSSTAFLRLLADCTDLPLAAYRRLELQRWRPGDFTVRCRRNDFRTHLRYIILAENGYPSSHYTVYIALSKLRVVLNASVTNIFLFVMNYFLYSTAAAAPRALPAAAPRGGAVPGRAGAPHLRRPDHVRGARGGRGRGGRLAGDAAAAAQRAQPRVLRRGRRLLHQVPEQDDHAAAPALLHPRLHLHRVTRRAQ